MKTRAGDLKDGDCIKMAGLIWEYYGRDNSVKDTVYVITKDTIGKCILDDNRKFKRVAIRKGLNIKELHKHLRKEIGEDGTPGRLPIKLSLFTGVFCFAEASITLLMYNDSNEIEDKIEDYNVEDTTEYFEPNCCDNCAESFRDCTSQRMVVILRPETEVNLLK